ncbi:hypothetical protein Trydic_g5826 [Trypoxylus dichotomus]
MLEGLAVKLLHFQTRTLLRYSTAPKLRLAEDSEKEKLDATRSRTLVTVGSGGRSRRRREQLVEAEEPSAAAVGVAPNGGGVRRVDRWGGNYGNVSVRPAFGPMGGPADMPRARANLEAEANSLYQPRRYRRPRRSVGDVVKDLRDVPELDSLPKKLLEEKKTRTSSILDQNHQIDGSNQRV